MKTLTRLTSLTAILLLAGATACNVHDNTITIPGWTINASADATATNVAPMQQVAVTVVPGNVYLVAPDATPPPEHVNDAGYINVYLDDTDSAPLLTTATATFNVTIPADTKPGPHNLVCRVHKHDGTPTTTEATVAITVAVSVGADGGVTTSIDASVTVGAGGAAGTTTTGAAGAGG